MIRPASIVRFEQLYLGALVLGIVNIVLLWSTTAALIAAQPALAGISSWYQLAATLVGIGIPLVLWYAVARRGSVIAKWIVVIWAGLMVVSLVFGLASGNIVAGAAGALGIGVVLLRLAAAWMLFRPDTRAWFGEVGTEDRLA